MELSPPKGTGVEGETAAASAVGDSEILYQNLIGDIYQSANTCKVMEVIGLANNGITSPEPSLLFGHMMGFPNTPISWEELYYGQLQFDLPTDLLTINIKDGCFEQHLQPTTMDRESLYVRLTKSVEVLLKGLLEEEHVMFGSINKNLVMALHGFDHWRISKLLSNHGLELQKRKAVMDQCIQIQKCMAISVSPGF